MAQIRIWLVALRIFSYTTALVPVLIGSLLAFQQTSLFNLSLFVAVTIASISVLAGTNLSDEYFDHLRGVDKGGSLGFKRVLKQQLLTPKQVLAAGLTFWAIAITLGLYIIIWTGFPILIIALLSLGAALIYTAGPLSQFGLGEFTVFIFMGPVIVLGSYFVQTGDVTWQTFWVSIPIAFLVTAILQANNIRDIDEDRASSKRTLATIIGKKGANLEYHLILSGAYLSLVGACLNGMIPWTALLPLITIPNAIALMRLVHKNSDALILTKVVKGTALVHAQFGFLFGLGIILGRLVSS